MKHAVRLLLGFVFATGLLVGCDGSSGDDPVYDPAVDVNGTWRTLADGTFLGNMDLQVTKEGKVSGTLTTWQDAVAKLDGIMEGYSTEFYVTFPNEQYFTALTFTSNGLAATGVLSESNGRRQTLRLDRILPTP